MTAPLVLSFAAGTLLLQGLARAEVHRLFGESFWTWDPRVDGWRCYASHYETVRRRLVAQSLAWCDRVPQWAAVRFPRPRLPVLRPDQEQARLSWLETQRGCIVMPTGTGKTEVALAIVAQVAVGTLIVVPIRDLMYQWHARIYEGCGYDAGLIGDNRYRVRPLSVTTYDSACIHMERLGNRFGLVIFDECHHLPGRVRQDAARMSAAPWRLGLTATFERADGQHALLPELIGPVVYRQGVAEARGATLAEYEIRRIAVRLTPAEQRQYDRLSRELRAYVAFRRQSEPAFTWQTLCGESPRSPEAWRALRAYHARRAIEHRADEKLRILEELFRLHDGEPCLVFAGSNRMAQDIARRFLIPCLLAPCGKQERREILQGLQQGVYRAVVANQVLDEGIDVPEVKVAIVVGGTASTRQAQQRLGRILRQAGNAPATLYEVVCQETSERRRSRQRRQCDAYQTTGAR